MLYEIRLCVAEQYKAQIGIEHSVFAISILINENVLP